MNTIIKMTYSYTKEGKVYTGWINEFTGMFAMADTIKELESELLKILKVKLNLLNINGCQLNLAQTKQIKT